MNLKSGIYSAFLRKALSIFLMMLISIGFSFSSALAGSCEGGADCLICGQRQHGQVPHTAAGMENPGCPPGGQNSPCGVEAGQDPAEFHGFVSAIRSYHQPNDGIFAVVVDEYGQVLLQKEFVPLYLLSDSSGTAPIYLLNQTLLC